MSVDGPGYLYLEIPRCGTTYIGDILINQCNGTRLTPRHDPLRYSVDRKKCRVFTTIRRPYSRMFSLWHYMDNNPQDFITWYERFRFSDNPAHIGQPYSFWTQNCDKVLKLETIEDTLPPFMKSLGFDIEMPPFQMKQYELSADDREYIKQERKQDFVQYGYKFDARSKL